MKKYKSKFEESNDTFNIINKSSLTDSELYELLMKSGHRTISMWKNDRSNLIKYLIDMLER